MVGIFYFSDSSLRTKPIFWHSAQRSGFYFCGNYFHNLVEAEYYEAKTM